jgi:hypothetical protein
LVRIGIAKLRQPDEVERGVDALPLAFQDALRFKS